MGLLIIVVVFSILVARRSGRPLKLVLTADEARAVRARWWMNAKGELRLWAVCFILGAALVYDPIVAAHWKPVVYVVITWGSLVLFSRLALWATLFAGLLGFGLDAVSGTFGKPLFDPRIAALAIGFAFVAMAIRAVVTLLRPRQYPPPLPKPTENVLENHIH